MSTRQAGTPAATAMIVLAAALTPLGRAQDADPVRHDALAILRNAVTSNPARSDLQRNIDSLENIALLRTQR